MSIIKIIKSFKDFLNKQNDFDDSKLSQLRLWNTSLIFSIISTLSFALVFAFIAKIDEVVVARGEIQALGAERPIKSKISGIIEKVFWPSSVEVAEPIEVQHLLERA